MPRKIIPLNDFETHIAQEYYEWLSRDNLSYQNQRIFIENHLERKVIKNTFDENKAWKLYYELAYINKKRFNIDIHLRAEILRTVAKKFTRDFMVLVGIDHNI